MGTVKFALRPSKILEHLDMDELRALAAKLLDGGMTQEEVADELAAVMDAVIVWETIIPNEVGVVIERLDRPLVLRPIAKQIVRFVFEPEQRKKVVDLFRKKPKS